jgi:molybdopterin-guanine dinucleotide biosynthesis protein A
MLRTEAATRFSAAIDAGQKKLLHLLQATGGGLSSACDIQQIYAAESPSQEDMNRWFLNVNTPEDLARAQTYAPV